MPLKKKGKRARRQPRNPPAMLPEAEQAEWKAFLSQFMPSAEHRAQIRRFRKLPFADDQDVIMRTVGAFFNWQDRMRAKKRRIKDPSDDNEE